MGCVVRGQSPLPGCLPFGPALDRLAELPQRLLGEVKGSLRGPAESPFRQTDLLFPEWLAVNLISVVLVRAAVANMRAGDNEGGPVLDGAGGRQGRRHRFRIHTVNPLHVPA